jgi:hypothetical protein
MVESAATPFEIVDIGPVARRALVDGASGRVEAVFQRSFYMVVDGQWICLGPDTLGSGPLNALYRPSLSRSGELCRPTRGDSVRVLGNALQVGRGIFAGIDRAAEPSPVAASDWSVVTLDAGLQAFDALNDGMFPSEGLAPLCRARAGAPRSALLVRGEAPAARLTNLVRARAASLRVEGGFDAGPLAHRAEKWTRFSAPNDAPLEEESIGWIPKVESTFGSDALVSLLGLGPGLTPSGDDLLGGALVALQALGMEDLRDSIWAVLRARAMTDTNEISFAHLAAAAEGHCSTVLRRALNTLMSGSIDDLQSAIWAVGRIGHTSGWDALAGILIVLRAFRDARSNPVTTHFLNSAHIH